MTLTNEQAKVIIEPVLKAYEEAFDKGDLENVGAIYGPGAVLIHTGKNCSYGREDIKKALAPFAVPADTKVFDKVIEGTSDHIVYKGGFKTTIKANGAVFEGKFQQIFRKDGDQWLIIYDEFEC